MEMISEEEWDSGKVSKGSEEKRKKILESMDGRVGYSRKKLSEVSGIKWVYSEVMRMVGDGIIEREKFGRKYMYRKVK